MAAASNICELVKAKLSYTGRPVMGLLESLVSPLNIQATNFTPQGALPSGKKKTMLVRYNKPASIADVTVGPIGTPSFCEGNPFTYLEEQYDIDTKVQYSVEIDDYTMSAFCEDRDTVVADMIKSAIDAFLGKLDSELISMFDNLRGNTSAGNINVIPGLAFSDLTNNIASVNIMTEISAEYRRLKASALQRIIVGGELLARYQEATGIGCCNTNGQDTSRFIGANATYYDHYMDADTLGIAPANNDWFVFPAGLVQLLDWSIVAPVNNGVIGNSEFNTVLEVQVGEDSRFPIDLKIVRSSCDSKWIVTLTKFFGLMTFPTDYFPVSDSLAGVNFLTRFRPTTA